LLIPFLALLLAFKVSAEEKYIGCPSIKQAIEGLIDCRGRTELDAAQL